MDRVAHDADGAQPRLLALEEGTPRLELGVAPHLGERAHRVVRNVVCRELALEVGARAAAGPSRDQIDDLVEPGLTLCFAGRENGGRELFPAEQRHETGERWAGRPDHDVAVTGGKDAVPGQLRQV